METAVEGATRAPAIEQDPDFLLHRSHRLLQDNQVAHVYFQFVAVSGRVLGKAVPTTHFERCGAKGVRFHPSAVTDLAVDTSGELIGYDLATHECVGIPDLSTLQVLPWNPRVARVFCDLRWREDEPGDDAGQPVPTDARGLLKRATAALSEERGLRLMSGCEPEMSWFDDPKDLSRVGHLPEHVSPAYHLGHLERMHAVLAKVTEYGTALGLDMAEGDYEDDRQLELTFSFDDCLATADRLTTYRQICAQVARELGLAATFMPKPLPGIMANGCHHNISLWDAERNLMEDPGQTKTHLSKLGEHTVAGLLAHNRAMTAVMSPTVNSYARFWDEGLAAPTVTNWGFDNKTCTVRVAGGRLEYKQPDSSVNPYLSHALMIAAIKDGIDRKLDPGPPQPGNSYDPAVQAAAPSRFPAAPRTLGEAVEAFEADELVKGALPKELFESYCSMKHDEWARYCGAVTSWHRDMYFNILP
jgi:glutamine synthetase